jgi:predicted phage terminase large subunit-like protein
MMVKIDQEDLELMEHLAAMEARENFWAYRQYMNPRMKIGWFQRQLCAELQRFWLRYKAGTRPILIVMTPPQHGKSEIITDFCSWAAGKEPSIKTIYASFSDRLGLRANARIQRTVDNPRYRLAFPSTTISLGRKITDGQRTSTFIEFIGHGGSFRNTTVQGPITGESLELGIIDDPIKGRAAANSATVRDSTWDWLTDDFFSRFADYAGMVMPMTRWHPDDPAGRLIEREPRVRILRFPAIAETDEPNRRAGEPLFPEHKSLEFLLQRKSLMSLSSWESLYQQNPMLPDGNMFKVDKMEIVRAAPKIIKMVRYWDKAGTEGDGAYTCGTKMGRGVDGRFYVLDVVRGQWSTGTRERIILQTAEMDGRDVKVWIEQEPGSGGKESAEATMRNLTGFMVGLDKVTGSKELRADPFATAVECGNVSLVRGDWNREFIEEHRAFPGKYLDQVDSASGAYAKLAVAGLDYEKLTKL